MPEKEVVSHALHSQLKLVATYNVFLHKYHSYYLKHFQLLQATSDSQHSLL